MYSSSLFMVSALLATTTLAATIPLSTRQSPCFVIGNTVLPAEVSDAAASLASKITCSTTSTTIAKVPDVSTSGTSFSSINFATSSQTPLAFALSTFATANPLTGEDLADFEAMLDVYIATEAGIRSVAGPLQIKVPKFFLAFQVARIKTAQGVANPEPGQQVDHLLQKVLKNAGSESAALLDQVKALATQLK